MGAEKTNLVLNDRYKLIEKIGRGGMAEVWLAHDKTLERQVAVKIMLPEFASDPDFTRRFKLEAAAAANLHSPYIVNVYDWGHDGDVQYIVMEYVRGNDLKTVINDKGPLTARQAAKIGSQVCEALAAAHHQDLIHRDIKPQNIMIQPDGNIKVMDFGIARAKNSTEQKTQMVLGTAHYISPEQAQGRNLTAASDIYSLGIVLYEAVSGKVPFDGPDAVSVALKQVEAKPRPLTEVVPGIDPQFSDIVAVALEKQPSRRFASALDMGHLLDDFAHGRSVSSSAATQVISSAEADRTMVMQNRPVDPQLKVGEKPEEEEEEPKNKKKVIGIVAAVTVAIIAAIIAAMMFFGGDKQIEVPDVSGMDATAAVAALEKAGFKVGDKKEVPSADIAAGKVIKTDPAAGEKLDKGSTVIIEISSGVAQVQVPNLHNMDEAQAIKALEGAGLKGARGTSKFSTTVEKGKIMDQNPAAGNTVDAGTIITYVISDGAEDPTMPDLIGKTEDEAIAALRDLGLKVLVGSRQSSNSVEAGHVISSNPNPGVKVGAGSQVTLVISTGVAEVEVPSLTGLSRAAARSTLVNVGLNLGEVDTDYSDEPIDSVISQSVPYGTSVAKGTTIDVVLSRGPKPEPPSPGPGNTNTNSGGSSNSNGNSNGAD